MVELRRAKRDASQEELTAALNRQVLRDRGDAGGRIWLIGDDGVRRAIQKGAVVDSNNYPLRVRSGIPNHVQVQHSVTAADLMLIQDSGITIPVIIGDTRFANNVDVDGTFNADGATSLNGAVTLGDAAADAVLVKGTATFTPLATFTGGLTATGALTANGNVTLGDAAADAILVKGTATFQVPLLTSDIAVGAITQRAQSATFSGTRTVASYADVDSTNGKVTMTTAGGDLLALYMGSATNNTAGTIHHLGLRLDSGSDVGAIACSCVPGAANYSVPFLVGWLFTGVSAAAHTVFARFQNTSGAGTFSATGYIILLEIKR